MLYVAIGDSAAQGIGASRPDRSYVGVLADDIRNLTGRSLRVVNLSVSGATTELAVLDQLPRLAKLSPDLVTVAIGANDIASWDPAVFERNVGPDTPGLTFVPNPPPAEPWLMPGIEEQRGRL